ncbi:ZZ-type zinc finger-containing protein 3 [Triplophysa dalaica]|uniref:ZZ-type zinc finger-containing protein 3 n=1 Tax=Triplophysa dalaica TaxID=1582913 RepID=UPI0024DFE604|nr:ZZ-type zinc finger-containing protein 3 [Triplophysa dalaica]XP_056599197.1 ZZ-type zinc finger-containing protein 3 [Triplophysa dalaica]XP_056599198.1 ZZ-type zinc finger-containing protein 3 [Triplophysa dalaica]
MAASRSSRVTRSSVGINGLDENFCGRTLRNRSIAQPEESSSPPAPRARSPKKKQDCQQHQQSGAQVGKVAESKAESEPLPVYGKRGLPCSEKDESEKSDNCERSRAGGGPEASPALKRAKRCPRSGESHGVEEGAPLKPDSPDPAASKENDEEPKSNTSSIPRPGFDKEEQKDDGPAEDVIPPLQASENVKATNGLSELHKENSEVAALPAEPCASSATLNNSLSLLNGSQALPSFPDPTVPCRSPHPKQANESDSPQIDCEWNSTPEEATEAVLSREPEMEVEVDVVGDASQAQDESTNGSFQAEPQDPSDDCSNISGETVAGNSSQPSVEPPSFTEPQEHRYTLRTSPRRAACGSGLKASSPKPSSPHIDNGLLKEEATMVPLSSEEVSHKDSSHHALGLSCEADKELSLKAGVSGEVGISDSTVSRSTKELLASQVEEDEEEEEDPDVYYFESDHLALKHNKDYQRLLQTVSVLEAQRTQAIMDLETLARHQKEGLADPITFVDQLQKQVEMGLPRPQRVVQLPDIAWDQYTSGCGDFEREFCDKKRKTRQLQLIFDQVVLPARPKSPVDSKKEGDSSSIYSSSLPSSDGPEHSMSSSRTQMIRGRMCNQNKPDTFNQLWTVEEQKRLEQLLLKFPPEEVESKRWQKIADELGNRTAKQVASRVQKYFIKLTKAGIPVPGRTPNVCMYSKKASSKRQHHLNKHLYRPSTFLTSYEPPVYMDDEDERSYYYNSLQDNGADDSDEDGVPVELRHLPEYKELLELKKLKKQKLQEIHAESALTQHIGYKCDMCGMEPIQGVRWHCQDCLQDNAVDFCSTCSDCPFKTETHKPTHRLEPVYQVETFLDKDYCLPQNTGYNYLDPNYYPANR